MILLLDARYIPFRHLVADSKSDASAYTSICLQKRQNFAVFTLDVFLQLFLPYRQVMEDLFDNDFRTSRRSNGACILESSRNFKVQTRSSWAIDLASCDYIELGEGT